MTSPLTTFLLLLITVVLWQLLNRSPAAKRWKANLQGKTTHGSATASGSGSALDPDGSLQEKAGFVSNTSSAAIA